MTLSTNIYVLDPVDVKEMFHFCQGLLTRYDEPLHRPPAEQRWRDRPSQRWNGTEWVEDPDLRSISNEIGQVLPGILDIDYRASGPLREAQTECDEGCDPDDCSGRYHARACFADVDFDTAYSSKFSFGGCSQLHALLVSNLGQWLDGRGVRWEWRTEYTGEVFGGDERYTSLTTLLDSGVKAMEWFNDVVLPAIPAIAEDAARKHGESE